MKRRPEIEVTVERLAFGGKGVARLDNRVIFVEGGIPGDRARVRIRKVKQNYAEAQIVQLTEPSPLRQPAPCQHFGYCGGCKWQNLDYQQQLRFKKEQVVESLQHLAGIEAETVHPALPSPLLFGYRNKMEFSFTDRCWLPPDELDNPDIEKGFALGLHVPGSFNWVMHIEKCWLQDDVMNRILNFSQEYFARSGLSIFHLKLHRGLLRFLVIRKSFSRQNYMVNVVTFEPAEAQLQDFVDKLTGQFPQVVSVINTVNRKFAQIAFGEEEYLLRGSKTLQENIGEFSFEISANSFFQTNPLQAENLYRIVQEYVGNGNKLIWDLYSGTGTIAMFLSAAADQIVGFELVQSAVEDARSNCRKNGVGNCRFVAGEIRENLKRQTNRPDVVVCDPPRSGMHPDVVKYLTKIQPQKIIYVSCNPTTMARDVKLLSSYYFLKEVQPVDMFPHTYHIESVIKLERK